MGDFFAWTSRPAGSSGAARLDGGKLHKMSSKIKIGFVGLGQMGTPIALNLLKSGAELAVVSRSEGQFPEFRQSGVEASRAPRCLWGSEFIFLCLPSGATVENFLFDENMEGCLISRPIVVDLGTTGYPETLRIAGRLAQDNIEFLDSPISGMVARARDANLTVMCGGSRSAFDSVNELLSCIGTRILYMGRTGSGQLAKLINQLLFDVNAAALAEILPLAAKFDLDPALVGDIINNGTGRSYASEFFIPRVLEGDFSQGYPMAAAYKDLISGACLASEQCIPLPVTAAATATYQTALLQGYGDHDKGGMIQVFEHLLDVRFRR
jgi:3-hydroxyisobutyrate dehydrogenase-like beta-hydroxyacid dehydrogenase